MKKNVAYPQGFIYFNSFILLYGLVIKETNTFPFHCLSSTCLPCWLGPLNTPTASLQRGKTPTYNECPVT